LLEDTVVHRFPCGNRAKLGGDVGIREEFEQQFVRRIRSAEERNASGEAALGVALVKEARTCLAIAARTCVLEAACSASATRRDCSLQDSAFEGTSCSKTSPGVVWC
jgi:hypothetical protein